MAEENIFLFVPNLIGYARIVLALLSFYLMPCCPVPAVFCYLLSALLDAFDGHAARALNQSTKFGAMLDMLTDRCATMCLLVNLALLYPSYTFLFQLSMCLDIASHWLHLHSSTMQGSASHKAIDLSGNPILRLYYTSKRGCTGCRESAPWCACSSPASASCTSSPPPRTWPPSTSPSARRRRPRPSESHDTGEGGRERERERGREQNLQHQIDPQPSCSHCCCCFV
ncbi:CDP-diacylglycerol--inositol 3-phosphatidyltransferase isoform 1-T1 [Polymixia lowei]